MIKRDRRHISDIAVALIAVLLLVVLFSSCSVSRKTSSDSHGTYSYTAETVTGRDMGSIFGSMAVMIDTVSAWESYNITIYDTSRRDSVTNTYPVKARVNGVKQKNGTRVSATASQDSIFVHENGASSMHENGELEEKKDSAYKNKTSTVSDFLFFIFIIGLLVAVSYAFRYVLKNKLL